MIILIMGPSERVPLIVGNRNPYNPLYNPSFHFIFHFLFHSIQILIPKLYISLPYISLHNPYIPLSKRVPLILGHPPFLPLNTVRPELWPALIAEDETSLKGHWGYTGDNGKPSVNYYIVGLYRGYTKDILGLYLG